MINNAVINNAVPVICISPGKLRHGLFWLWMDSPTESAYSNFPRLVLSVCHMVCMRAMPQRLGCGTLCFYIPDLRTLSPTGQKLPLSQCFPPQCLAEMGQALSNGV